MGGRTGVGVHSGGGAEVHARGGVEVHSGAEGAVVGLRSARNKAARKVARKAATPGRSQAAVAALAQVDSAWDFFTGRLLR
jgi:hypothetical protein